MHIDTRIILCKLIGSPDALVMRGRDFVCVSLDACSICGLTASLCLLCCLAARRCCCSVVDVAGVFVFVCYFYVQVSFYGSVAVSLCVCASL